MQRRRIPVILHIDIHIVRLEVVQRNRLVPLRCNMHHIESVGVSDIHVCAIVHQSLHDLNVAFERRIVESCKFVLKCFLVDPLLKLILIQIFLRLFQQSNDAPRSIVESGHVQQTVPVLINNFVKFYFRRQGV